MQPQSRPKRLKALRNFLGHEGEGFIRKGQMFDTTESAAKAYLNQGLVEFPAERPTKAAAAEAMEEDARQKNATPSETKETTATTKAAAAEKKGK